MLAYKIREKKENKKKIKMMVNVCGSRSRCPFLFLFFLFFISSFHFSVRS